MITMKTFGRPALALVCALTLVAGAASAADHIRLARTNLPGYYSFDYDYHDTARYPIGINYYIPTREGVIESPVIPLLNPVDRYYATHEVINNEVVDESLDYETALAVPHFVNLDGTRGPAAIEEESYFYPVDMASAGFRTVINQVW